MWAAFLSSGAVRWESATQLHRRLGRREQGLAYRRRCFCRSLAGAREVTATRWASSKPGEQARPMPARPPPAIGTPGVDCWKATDGPPHQAPLDGSLTPPYFGRIDCIPMRITIVQRYPGAASAGPIATASIEQEGIA